jgi:ElaB/YqjD/DUF883 family membrane-anchored ribosome-binding protein
MDETTMSEAFRAATEGVKTGAAAIASETERRIRENGPRVVRSAQKSYDEANDYVGEVVGNRQLPAMLAIGAAGLLIGLVLGRR